MNVDMKLGQSVGLVSGGSNPTGPSNRQTKSVGRGLMSNPAVSELNGLFSLCSSTSNSDFHSILLGKESINLSVILCI